MRITNIVRSYLPVFGLLLSTALTIPTLALGALEGAYDNDGAGPSDASGVGQTADDNLEYDSENQKADEICDPDVNRRSDSADCKELKSENVSEDIMNAYFDTLSNAATMGIEVDSVKTMQAIQDGKIHTGQVIDKDGKVQTVSPGSSIDGSGGLRDTNNTDWSWDNPTQPGDSSEQKSSGQNPISKDELLGKDREFDSSGLKNNTDSDSDQATTGGGLSSDLAEPEDSVSDTSIETGSGFLPGEFKRDAQYSRATELDYENLFKATDGKVDDWVKEGKLDQKIAIEAGMIGLAHGSDMSKIQINGITASDIDKYGYIDPAFQAGVDVDSSLLTNKGKYNNAAFVKMLDKQIAPGIANLNNSDKAQVLMSYYVNVTERYKPAQAAGIIGNMAHESNLEHLRDAGGSENSTGLAQWNAARAAGQRRQSLESFAGEKFTGFYRDGGKEYWKNGPGFMTQAGYADAEMQGISPRRDAGAIKVGRKFASTPNMSAADAATLFQNQFERPLNRTATLRGRQNSANKYLANFVSLNGTDSGTRNSAGAERQAGTSPDSSGTTASLGVPKTGITTIDNAVNRLLTNGNVSIPSFGNFGGLFQTVQGIAGSFQNLFGRRGSGTAQNNTQSGSNNQGQPYTDLGGVIQSDLTSKATLAMATSTQGYQFWGSMKRTFLNNGSTDNYTGTSLTNKLIIDYYCDNTADAEKAFNMPYNVLADSKDDVIIASQMTLTVPGLHCFAFDVDANNQVPESNELNNRSNWREFMVEFKSSATSTSSDLPSITLEVAVYDTNGVKTTDWTSEDITIYKGDQLAFRWNAPLYDSCSPYLSLVSADWENNISPENRNTWDEGIDIQEHTGYYELGCKINDETEIRTIYVTLEK